VGKGWTAQALMQKLGISAAEWQAAGNDLPEVQPKKRKRKRKPIGDRVPAQVAKLLPPGELIASFAVESRPVPWSVPFVTRSGASIKDKRLVGWQHAVKKAARDAMAGKHPYPGPVRLEVWFYLTEARNKSVPDTSNLTKGSEDALQGLVIVNDRQVCEVHASREIGDRDGAEIKVYSCEGN
jgi:Holliday junction resolvase RusA-like endonuclease